MKVYVLLNTFVDRKNPENFRTQVAGVFINKELAETAKDQTIKILGEFHHLNQEYAITNEIQEHDLEGIGMIQSNFLN